MISKALLFPESAFLGAKWWHRLARVIFWAWFIAVLVWLIDAAVLEPYSVCVGSKVRMEMAIGRASGIDCGANALAYLSAHATVAGVVFFALLSYVGLLLPSLAYRLVLYVVKGSAWKDSSTSP